MNNCSFDQLTYAFTRVHFRALVFAFFFLISPFLSAQEEETIVIEAKKKTYKVQSSNSYIKVNKDVINERVEQNIAEIIGKEEGIQDYSSCSNCGAKRISMNGTKSEAMGITLDELPLYSTLSQFYGLDALGDSNLESFEVFSGAGEIKDQFESLSGLVNLQTLVPSFKKRDQKFFYETRFNSSGDNLISVRKNFRTGDDFAHILSFSRKKEDSVDLDKNNVAELPLKKSDNVFIKTKYSRSAFESNFLYNFSNSKTIGGNILGYELLNSPANQAEETDFEGNDVRKKYTGSPEKISDYVKIERQDGYIKNDIKISDTQYLDLDIGYSSQKQNSFFMHGFDYKNKNDVVVFNSKYLKVSDVGNFSFNFMRRDEKLKAESNELYIKKSPKLKKDDFNYFTNFVGVNYELERKFDYFNLKLSAGNKFENKKLIWTDFSRQINTDLTLLPYAKINLQNTHHDFSAYFGLRERAPIVNVETQHGNSEYGYDISIDQFEKVENFGFAYSFIQEFYQINLEYQVLNLKHVVYGLDRADSSQSTIFKNHQKDFKVQTLSNGYLWNPNEEFTFELLLEKFIHPTEYKKIQKSPLVEERLQFKATHEYDLIKNVLLFQFFSSRDLSLYGYDSNYNYAETDLLQTPSIIMKDQKRLKAPSYFTVDWMMDVEINPNFDLSFGVDNVFNVAQTKTYNDSPLSWARHGDHFHLDNMHLWGPLKGRVFWTKMRFDF